MLIHMREESVNVFIIFDIGIKENYMKKRLVFNTLMI